MAPNGRSISSTAFRGSSPRNGWTTNRNWCAMCSGTEQSPGSWEVHLTRQVEADELHDVREHVQPVGRVVRAPGDRGELWVEFGGELAGGRGERVLGATPEPDRGAGDLVGVPQRLVGLPLLLVHEGL